MMGVCITSGKCQLVEFLEEFLSCFRTLSQQRQLILGIGLLVGVLEGFFAFLTEILERSPSGYAHSNNLVDEVGCELFRQSPHKETEVESDLSRLVISKLVLVFFIIKELLMLELVPVLCICEVFRFLDMFLFRVPNYRSGDRGGNRSCSWVWVSTSSWYRGLFSSTSRRLVEISADWIYRRFW